MKLLYNVRTRISRWESRLGGERERSGYLLLKLFSASFFVIVVGKFALISLNALMARSLGASDYGVITIVINLCQILVLVFTLGIPTAGVRFVAVFNGQREWGKLAGYFNLSALAVFVGIAITLMIVSLCQIILVDKGRYVLTGWLVALILPPTIVGMVRGPLLRGFNNVWGSLMPREVVAPILAIAYLLVTSGVSALDMAVAYSIAYLAAEVLGLYLLWRRVPMQVFSAKPEYDLRQWLSISIPILVQGIARVILQRSDLLFVGAMLGLEAAGIYAVAHRLAMALVVVGRASSTAVSPLLAKAYHSENPKLIMAHLGYAMLVTVGIGVPVFIVLAIFSSWIVDVVFGSGYEESALLLVILAVGQLINALLNPINQALLMTEFEKVQLKLILVTTVVGLLGYPLVTHFGGIIGVACWTSFLLVAVNFLSYIIGFSKLRDKLSSSDEAKAVASIR